MTYWPGVVRTVDYIEGGYGTVLNCAVIYLLWKRNQTTKLLTYRICITIIALHGLLTSVIVVILCNTVHLIHVDAFLIILYGSIASISEPIDNFLSKISLLIPFWLIDIIPGACLLHYLTLCKPHLTNAQRLFLSYGPCIAMMFWPMPYYLSIHTSDRFTVLVSKIHHTTLTEQFVVMGMALMPTVEHPMGILNFALECVIPSYTISYGIFALTAMKCRSHLSTINIKFSEKTRTMHKRFLIMLALQNLLPLLILAIPVGIFCVALIGGLKVGLITLIISFSCWTLPIVQERVFPWVTQTPPNFNAFQVGETRDILIWGSISLMFVLRLNKTASTDIVRSTSLAQKNYSPSIPKIR